MFRYRIHRVLVLILILLGAAWPGRGLAQMGLGPKPIITSVTANPGTVSPGGNSTITCVANPNGGSLLKYGWLAPAGTSFLSGTTTYHPDNDNVWVAPAAPGNYLITVKAYNSGVFGGGPIASNPATVTVTVALANNAPLINSLVTSENPVFPGAAIQVTASVTDADGDPISYVWSATGGTISGQADADPWLVSWTAPTAPGNYTLTLTASDPLGASAAQGLGLDVVYAKPGTPFFVTMEDPVRIALGPDGRVYVVDHQAATLYVFYPTGNLDRSFYLAGKPLAVAVTRDGTILVTDLGQGGVKRFDGSGHFRDYFGPGPDAFRYPGDIAIDRLTNRVFVADALAGQIRVFEDTGSEVYAITAVTNPAGIHVRPEADRLYATESKTLEIKVLTLAGAPVASFGGAGPAFSSAAGGKFGRVQALAADAGGMIYVPDVFNSNLQVLTESGTFVAYLGSYGAGNDQLLQPKDVVVDQFDRILVVSAGDGKIKVFNQPGSIPATCPFDSDCDGLPDSWEISHGLNPLDYTDAMADPDLDGLTNLEEYQLGLNPLDPDTDHDGVDDGQELAQGSNPNDPTDQRPVADAGPDQTSAPTRVMLGGYSSSDPNGDPLTYLWELGSGPAPAVLMGATAAAVLADLTHAGDYIFRLTVNDGKVSSLPDEVTVTILNVAPRVVARFQSVMPAGSTGRLDGRATQDANGDPLTFHWDQIAGPTAALADPSAAETTFIPAEAGTYEFALTANDGVQDGEPDYAMIVVHSADNSVPWADAGPDRTLSLGQVVLLDAANSYDPDGDPLTYTWWQRQGPPLSLDPAAPLLVFAPAAGGIYEFALQVSDGLVESPEDSVTLVVNDPADPLPLSRAWENEKVQVSPIGQMVWLDSLHYSSDPLRRPLTYSWTQTGGPVVSLDGADAGDPRFIPVVRGAYIFTVRVSAGSFWSLPDSTTVLVYDPADHLPTAQAGADQVALPGDTVTLDGTGSSDQENDPFSSFWSQTGGPWVLLDDPASLTPSFAAAVAGLYTFELLVFDAQGLGTADEASIAVGAPLADAGPDQLATTGETVQLHGLAENVIAGDSLEFLWSQSRGPMTPLNDYHTAAPVLTPELPGESYGYRLRVYDGAVLSLPDETLVHVADIPGVLALVPAGRGGVMMADLPAFRDVRVNFGPAAVAQDTLVGMGLVFSPPGLPRGFVLASTPLFLAPADAAVRQPIQVTVPLKGSVDPRKLKLIYRDPSGHWSVLENAVTVRQGLATYSLPGLGISAVAGAAKAPAAGPGRDSGSKGSDRRCFIATAAYGADHPRVETLRRFRDQVLLPNAPGRALVAAYYRLSPPLAEQIARRAWLSELVRLALAPMAAAARLALVLPFSGFSLAGFLLGVFSLAALVRSQKRVGLSLLLLALALLARPAQALDPPHGSANNIDCASCHVLHRSAAGSLNKATGIQNLCLSCHTSGDPLAGNRAFKPEDQAIPGTGGTSHSWSAPAVSVSYGTTTNVNAAIKGRFEQINPALTSTWRLTCANCHDPHRHDQRDGSGNLITQRDPWDPASPAPANPSPTSPAGRHFMRMDNDENQLCLECHQNWKMDQTGASQFNPGDYDGNFKSHPVNVVLPGDAVHHNGVPYDVNGAAQTGAPRYAGNAAGEGNASNNLVLSPTGKIQCLSCHGAHQTDSNESTIDPW